MANKRITIYEREKYVVISEYNYDTGKATLKVAKRTSNGDYNPNNAEDFCKYFNIDANVVSTNGNEVSFDVTNTGNLQETIKTIAVLDKSQYIKVDNNQIVLKIYLS